MPPKSYRPWSPDQSFLLPPSPREWLPEGHLAYFLLDVVAELDLRAIESKIHAKDPRGTRPYSPHMMVGLLIYGYCVGVRSSRKIERATYEDVAFRVLAGGSHPDHSRISDFRRQHKAAFQGLFLDVLRLCQKAGLVKLGHLAIDGTKLQGNASKHKAMSHQRMVELEARLSEEIEAILTQAEQADAEEDARLGVGVREEDLPEELRRREHRLARIREAKQALETEARRSRAQTLRDQAAGSRQTAARHADESVRRRSLTNAKKREVQAQDLDDEDPDPPSSGALPRHRVRARPDGTPDPKAQRNFTDPESRLMEQGGAYLQGYNGQAAVDEAHQIIVAADLTNQSPDNGNLVPMLDQVRENCGSTSPVVTADSGYWRPEVPGQCRERGSDAYIATERRKHWDRDASVPEGPGPDEQDDPRAAMRWKLRTEEGRALYARRKVIVEPVFGQIKEARGIRRLLLRGLEAARAEWQLICLTHNLLKLHRSQVRQLG